MEGAKVSTFEEELRSNGKLIYTNVGVSMLPLLREGRDVMVIERRDAAALKRYDAVLFRRPGVRGRGAYVLHRILRIRPDGTYWIVGDNCTGGENVNAADILGVLTAVRRGNRTVHVTDFGYRMYVALWCAPYPLRFTVLKTKNFVRRISGAVTRRIRRSSTTHH